MAVYTHIKFFYSMFNLRCRQTDFVASVLSPVSVLLGTDDKLSTVSLLPAIN